MTKGKVEENQMDSKSIKNPKSLNRFEKNPKKTENRRYKKQKNKQKTIENVVPIEIQRKSESSDNKIQRNPLKKMKNRILRFVRMVSIKSRKSHQESS